MSDHDHVLEIYQLHVHSQANIGSMTQLQRHAFLRFERAADHSKAPQ